MFKSPAQAAKVWPILTFVAVILIAIWTTGRMARADYHPGPNPVFGTYSKAYLDRHRLKQWKEQCKGAGRYQAMSEAYEAGKPDPCNPRAKEWIR